MKDVVNNRKHISLTRKLKIAWIAFRENGPLWCLTFAAYYATSSVADRAHSAMDRMRRMRNIPGLNSAALNKEIWEAWDWSTGGEEWSTSEDHKQSLIRCVLQPEIPQSSRILEIGPGGGRWTEALLSRAHDYVGVDISATCVEHCRRRFQDVSQAKFLVGTGRDLAEIPDGSIDAIWSFDVFVHINRTEVQAYAKEFKRVLSGGGVAVIHHGAVGGSQGGWRSDLTSTDFASILATNGFSVRKSMDQWTDQTRAYPLTYGDLITVFSTSDNPAPSIT